MIGSIISNIADVLVLVALFGVTILVHELGHFLVALRCGMVVETFSIGFGPSLWKRTYRGTVYKVGLIPFGGYVSLPQLDPAGMELLQGDSKAEAGSRGRKRSAAPDPQAAELAERRRHLPVIAPWKRILVTLAGPIGNVVFGVILAWIVYLGPEVADRETAAVIGTVETNSVAAAAGVRMGDEIVAVNDQKVSTWYDYNVECTLQAGTEGEVTLTIRSDGEERDVRLPLAENEAGSVAVPGLGKALPCLLGEVIPGGSAAQAGLKAGDVVKEFNGVPVVDWDQFRALVAEAHDQPSSIVVERDGTDFATTVTPMLDPEENRPLIGVQLGVRPVMPWMMYRRPLAQIRGDATSIVRILRALVTPRESRQAAGALGGPIMILTALWVSIQISIMNAFGFLRFLNINLAILNLLPIPVLDGGHIVFAAWEALTRRKVHPRFVNILVNIFAVILIGAMLIISYRDLRRIFPGLFRLFNRDVPAATQPEDVEPPAVP
jgi:regulator of sigma E protease